MIFWWVAWQDEMMHLTSFRIQVGIRDWLTQSIHWVYSQLLLLKVSHCWTPVQGSQSPTDPRNWPYLYFQSPYLTCNDCHVISSLNSLTNGLGVKFKLITESRIQNIYTIFYFIPNLTKYYTEIPSLHEFINFEPPVKIFFIKKSHFSSSLKL